MVNIEEPEDVDTIKDNDTVDLTYKEEGSPIIIDSDKDNREEAQLMNKLLAIKTTPARDTFQRKCILGCEVKLFKAGTTIRFLPESCGIRLDLPEFNFERDGPEEPPIWTEIYGPHFDLSLAISS